MNYPERDLSCQYISSSYQDVLQQYVTTGSLVHVLDGLGNVVFSIPSSSLGNVLITSDITASMTVLSASYSSVIEIYQTSSSFASSSISASYAYEATYSDTASVAIYSEYAGTASLAAEAISASYSETASYVDPSTISHNELQGLQGGSGGDYYHLDSASYASITSGTSSYAINSLTASYAENAGGGTSLETGSTYPITSSWAISASWAPS
jgi:hypothetical protein